MTLVQGKQTAIFFFGYPGSGKTIQIGMVKNAVLKPIAVYATGVLVRGHVSLGTPQGIAAKQAEQEGILVEDSTVLEMLFQKNFGYNACGAHPGQVIFDGFPRNRLQYKRDLPRFLGRIYAEKPKIVAVHLKVPRAVARERLAYRVVCKNEHTFGNGFREGDPCIYCGTRLTSRPDVAKADQRITTFLNETYPLIRNLARNKTVEFLRVNGHDTEKNVHHKIMQKLYDAGVVLL